VHKFILVATTCFAFAALLPGGALAGNPSGTGLPSQECEAVVAAGGHEPGNAANSPGSPFKEEGIAGVGGTGGEHYNPISQYDVACYQISRTH
jgi:hypothetical protein